MDGHETCRILRDNRNKMTIVALTGWSQEKDQQFAIAAGFDAHLTKPADPAAVIEVARQGNRDL